MANQFTIICYTIFGTLQAVMGTSPGLRLNSNAETAHKATLVQSPQVEQQLVICNAYASMKALEIMQVRSRLSLTQGSPLAYKQCKDFTVPLEEGDQLDFKAGGLDVGTFYATGLPKSASSLLLIPHRRSPHAVGVSFESHAFAELKSPQIAIIDAFRGAGSRNGKVHIIEAAEEGAGKTQVEEELKFNSVVAVNPGSYHISLTGTGGDNATVVPLKAADATKYVVMRLGIEGDSKHANRFPLELVVYPNSAARLVLQMSVALVAAAAVFLNF